MTSPKLLAAAGAAALLVTACADYGPGFGPGPGYYAPGPVAVDSYDGFYDGGYGPFFDGYWGVDNHYYYRGHGRDAWHRDDAGHFSRTAAPRMAAVHGHARGGGGARRR